MLSGSRHHSISHLPCLFALFSLAASAWAQKDTGSIVGTVKPASGSVRIEIQFLASR